MITLRRLSQLRAEYINSVRNGGDVPQYIKQQLVQQLNIKHNGRK